MTVTPDKPPFMDYRFLDFGIVCPVCEFSPKYIRNLAIRNEPRFGRIDSIAITIVGKCGHQWDIVLEQYVDPSFNFEMIGYNRIHDDEFLKPIRIDNDTP